MEAALTLPPNDMQFALAAVVSPKSSSAPVVDMVINLILQIAI